MPAGHPLDDGPLRALLDSAHEAFVSMDAEGHVLVWNRMASETFGWSEQEARGRLLGDLIVPERYREAHEAGLRRLAATGEGRIVNRRIEIEGLHRDGHELPVELTISPMQTHAGVVFNAFLHDISDRREAEAGARRLAALVEGSEDAIVASDLDGTLTDWNPGAQRLYGYSADEALGMSVSTLRPSGEDEEVEQLLAALRADRRIPSYDACHQRKDGSSVDVSVSLSAVRDGSRSVIGVAAFIRDITERVEADRSLQEARKRFQTTFEEAPTGIGLVDPQGRWLSANSSLCRLVGRDVADLLITDFQSITHPDDLGADLAQMEATLAGSTAGYEMEKRFIRPDGSVVWAQLNRSLVRDDHGAPLYFITQLMDISERKKAEEELQRYGDHLSELARLDPLTGLRNFRDLHAMLDTETARSRRYDAHWSVVLLDVDGFREINASGGQVTGDRVLRQVAAAIEEASRASDLAARTVATSSLCCYPRHRLKPRSSPRAGLPPRSRRAQMGSRCRWARRPGPMTASPRSWCCCAPTCSSKRPSGSPRRAPTRQAGPPAARASGASSPSRASSSAWTWPTWPSSHPTARSFMRYPEMPARLGSRRGLRCLWRPLTASDCSRVASRVRYETPPRSRS